MKYSKSNILTFTSSLTIRRSFVKIGDKIPVNYIKDGKDPEVLSDDQYPEYVLKLTEPLLTKSQLLAKFNKFGETSFSLHDIRRLKRLNRLEKMRAKNLEAN